MDLPLSPQALIDRAETALDLAAHGIAWVGVRREPSVAGTLAVGQAAVEYFIPRRLESDLPLVLIHGGGQGTDFMVRVDGGPGWLHHFVAAGRAVYVIDLPGHGRSPGHALQIGDTAPPMSFELADAMFVAPERSSHAWPGATSHTAWPEGEEAANSFVAGAGPMRLDVAAGQSDGAVAIANLLDRIGRAVLITHSAGGPIGWLAADLRPSAVAGIVSLEPLGPPVDGMGPMALPWGVTAAPITYEPSAASADELHFVENTGGGGKLQRTPARQLANLVTIPICVMSAEASWMEDADRGTVAFLTQAGCRAEQIRLGDRDVHGNGHLAMLETNNAASAAIIVRWLAENGL
jgi:pimeloyl-ACP methyl ester carboxylesterase